MTDFKKAIYSNYVQHHTQQLYGRETLQGLRSKFPAWRYYFGNLLPKSKAAVVLDIGCGDGGFVFFLQSMGYTHAEGIDISQQQIEVGRYLGIKNLQVSDLHEFLIDKQSSFDCIVARDVMEHLTRQEMFEAMQKIYSALRPGGSFILQSPNGEGIFYASIFYGDYTHEIAFTETSLSQLCRNTGFEHLQFKATGPVPHGIFSLIRWGLWQLIVLKAKFFKMIETGSWGGTYTQNIIAKATRY